MRAINLALLLLIQLFSINTAKASFSDFIDNGNYTSDTISGLDWYDVSLTQGQSYNDIIPLTNTGSSLSGWSFATASEFKSMLANFLDIPSSGYYSPSSGTLLPLITMLGSTSTSNNASAIDGRVINGATTTQLDRALIVTRPNSEFNDLAISHNGIILNIDNDSAVGSFLVRQSVAPVPVPAAFWLMGSGIIGLVSLSRKKTL